MPILFPRFTRASLLANVHLDPRWPVIGPHEEREAALMMLCWKPAAYFCDGADFDPSEAEETLMALAEAGIVDRHQRLRPGLSGARFYDALREAIYVLPGQTDLVATLRHLSTHWERQRPDLGFAAEFAFAHALGYSDADIRSFIWHAYG